MTQPGIEPRAMSAIKTKQSTDQVQLVIPKVVCKNALGCRWKDASDTLKNVWLGFMAYQPL